MAASYSVSILLAACSLLILTCCAELPVHWLASLNCTKTTPSISTTSLDSGDRCQPEAVKLTSFLFPFLLPSPWWKRSTEEHTSSIHLYIPSPTQLYIRPGAELREAFERPHSCPSTTMLRKTLPALVARGWKFMYPLVAAAGQEIVRMVSSHESTKTARAAEFSIYRTGGSCSTCGWTR